MTAMAVGVRCTWASKSSCRHCCGYAASVLFQAASCLRRSSGDKGGWEAKDGVVFCMDLLLAQEHTFSSGCSRTGQIYDDAFNFTGICSTHLTLELRSFPGNCS